MNGSTGATGRASRTFTPGFAEDQPAPQPVGQTALLWRITGPGQTGKPISLSGFNDTVEVIYVSSNGEWAATSQKDQRVRVWHLQDGQAREAASIPKAASAFSSIDLSNSGRWLAIGGSSGYRLWDLRAGVGAQLMVEGEVASGAFLRSVTLSQDGHWLAVLGRARQSEAREPGSERGDVVIVFDLLASTPSESMVELPVGREALRTIRFTLDGRWLVATADIREGDQSRDRGAAHVWKTDELASGAQPRFTLNTPNPIYRLEVSADGRWVATGVSNEFVRDQTARVWDLNSSDPSAAPFLLAQHQGVVSALAFSTDSRFFATGADDKVVRVWDLNAKDVAASLRSLKGLDDAVAGVTFESAGQYVVGFERSGQGRIWPLAQLEQSNASVLFAGLQGMAIRLLVSRDSQTLVTIGANGKVQRWALSPTGSATAPTTLGFASDAFTRAALSPNGRWFASDGKSVGPRSEEDDEHTVRLWDMQAEAASVPLVLRVAGGGVRALAFSADSQWLASGGSDGKSGSGNLELRGPASITN